MENKSVIKCYIYVGKLRLGEFSILLPLKLMKFDSEKSNSIGLVAPKDDSFKINEFSGPVIVTILDERITFAGHYLRVVFFFFFISVRFY